MLKDVTPSDRAREFLGEGNKAKYTDPDAVTGMISVLDELLDTLRINYFDSTKETFSTGLANVVYAAYLLASRLDIDLDTLLVSVHHDMMEKKGGVVAALKKVSNG